MKKSTFLWVFAGVLALLASAGGASCASLVVPAPTSGPRVLRAVAYGVDPAQKMDVYVPVGFTGQRPGVALIHGGGWQGGDKGF